LSTAVFCYGNLSRASPKKFVGQMVPALLTAQLSAHIVLVGCGQISLHGHGYDTNDSYWNTNAKSVASPRRGGVRAAFLDLQLTSYMFCAVWVECVAPLSLHLLTWSKRGCNPLFSVTSTPPLESRWAQMARVWL
jgi:hypothetical protein